MSAASDELPKIVKEGWLLKRGMYATTPRPYWSLTVSTGCRLEYLVVISVITVFLGLIPI